MTHIKLILLASLLILATVTTVGGYGYNLQAKAADDSSGSGSGSGPSGSDSGSISGGTGDTSGGGSDGGTTSPDTSGSGPGSGTGSVPGTGGTCSTTSGPQCNGGESGTGSTPSHSGSKHHHHSSGSSLITVDPKHGGLIQIPSNRTDYPDNDPSIIQVHVTSANKDIIGAWHITGEITNVGNDSLQFVHITAHLYDATSQLVSNGDGYTSPTNLDTQPTGTFDTLITKDTLSGTPTSYRLS